jgi:hypothetical protein
LTSRSEIDVRAESRARLSVAIKPLHSANRSCERPAARLVEAHRQQVLRRDVGVDHAQLRIEHDDARGERVEQVGGS